VQGLVESMLLAYSRVVVALSVPDVAMAPRFPAQEELMV